VTLEELLVEDLNKIFPQNHTLDYLNESELGIFMKYYCILLIVLSLDAAEGNCQMHGSYEGTGYFFYVLTI